jgi:hypothetical protein
MNCRIVAAVMLLVLLLSWPALVLAQSTNATVTGFVTDPTKAVVVGAKVDVINMDTNIRYTATTNQAGSYTASNLPPGPYRIEVQKPGFKTVVKSDLVLHVQDTAAINFEMAVGSVSETVTVQAGGLVIDTQDAAVSTVIDRQFAENLPMNGRSFQTLIELAPGVVVTPSNIEDAGQFSVNGQRPSSNYWMVDGVSANIGVSPFNPGNGLAGSVGSFGVLGGTNSLVSVDAMQEFRIQTSTFAPEFGRTPGAQISIVTRSGTNQFHGTAFDYFRNDALDANDWFADNAGLSKPEERQNDFGGTLSGPILKDRTFFFFSYEGLRLQLPEVAIDDVPSVSARENAISALQPFLNAYPLPRVGAPDNDGMSPLDASYSNRSSLDAYSLRIDHRLTTNVTLFGRYNYSPSELDLRGGGNALSDVTPINITTQTGTLGVTWAISPLVANDFRFNYSRTGASDYSYLDNFLGAVPLTSVPFPAPFTTNDGLFNFDILALSGSGIGAGKNANITQRQFNIVDGLSMQKGSHSVKIGADYRRLSPEYGPSSYNQLVGFPDVPSAEFGSLEFSYVATYRKSELLFHNLGLFAQDTWRLSPKLTLTYGLRWDVDFAPQGQDNLNIPGVTNFNLTNLSNLALAPSGTPPFYTKYGNFAPRLGIAYQLSQSPNWQTVLRGGFGIFYDLATSEVGNLVGSGLYPFAGSQFVFGGSFPLSPAVAAPPTIAPANGIVAFDPHLELPYSLQWNVSLEQALGSQQSLSLTYVGSAGRRLLQTAAVSSPNPSFASADIVGNLGTSNYNALQAQFQRRLSHGLQALASYTWSHSIDDGSAGSPEISSNGFVPGLSPTANRGPSDFDIRNAASAALTYDIPGIKANPVAKAVSSGWSLQSIVQAHSAPPVNIYDSLFYEFNGAQTAVRPDVFPRIPLYLYGPQYPGGKAINNTPGAVAGGCSDGSLSVGPFCPPPTDPTTGLPLRQGDLGRNALRAFNLVQWDLAIHRDFPLGESLKLQFRAEMFNVLNHPNFGPPIGDLNNTQFGLSTQTLAQSLNGGIAGSNFGGGSFDPLYQIGGPRSIQLALKLVF